MDISEGAMDTHLTEKQSNILAFISLWNRENGFPPSLKEISDHFNVASTNTIRCHLKAIEKKGYIHINPRKARGIQIIRSEEMPEKNSTDRAIPILGRIAAGVPIWTEQNIDGSIPIPPNFFGEGEIFALRVCGDSMVNAGIFDKDIAVIRKQSRVENGEIAAVCIENEITLKRFYMTDTEITLKSENSNNQDMIFNNNVTISVVGRLQGVLRKGQTKCH
jgi:repressor LexA